jgi:hypothetical protein
VSVLRRAPFVAAYVCPRGVFAILCRRTLGGVEIDRVLEAPATTDGELGSADHLVSVLRNAAIPRATVSITLRGFGVVHHMLQLPPAKDDILGPIIERELRRLEPDLADAVIGWTPLPPMELGSEQVVQRSVLAAAAPRVTITAFEKALASAGYSLSHVTALPVAMQRLIEEFDEGGGSVALVAPLPDGAFMGFALSGALRLVVEPPLPKEAEHESSALAEELELGAMFVRQQFRGAQLDRIALVGSGERLADAENVLTDRLQLPAKQLGVRTLSPAALAALGAMLDSQSARPLSLGGESRGRAAAGPASMLRSGSLAAMFALAAVGAWTVTETVRAERAKSAVSATRQRVQQDSFGLVPIRATADQRRLVRDAMAAARVVAKDRVLLQEALAGLAMAVQPPVHIDSLSLQRVEPGWKAALSGSVDGLSTGQAVQYAYEAYRELPQRTKIDSLNLVQLGYSDSGAVRRGEALVRFQLSFIVSKKN